MDGISGTPGLQGRLGAPGAAGLPGLIGLAGPKVSVSVCKYDINITLYVRYVC